MSEVKDLVMPMLKGIQAKLTGVEAKLNDVAKTTLKTEQKVEDLEGLMTFHLGLTTGHKHDIQSLKAKIAAFEKRLAAVEARS
jgi:predicted  nucleic acid-binding Zn-ribbon protein